MNPLQRSPEWHQQRAGRLTASLFGAAVGLSPYMSRQALWRQLTGRSEAFEGNEATEHGTTYEPIAVSAYEVETGEIVIPAPFVPYSDWSGASPDGYVGKDGLIEVKCPFSQKMYEVWPDHYRAQVLGQLAITGRAWCDCWCWTFEGGKVVERIHANPDQWAELEVALGDFWKCVMADEEPKRQKKFQFNVKETA